MSNGILQTASDGTHSSDMGLVAQTSLRRRRLRCENRFGVRQLCMILMGLSVLSSLSGCNIVRGVKDYAAYNTPVEDFMTGWRDRVWGKRAYNARRAYMNPPVYEADFRKGFLAGYRNIAQGGQGCTPSLPPREYWSWKYQSAEGQAKVAAWFSGFPLGARAAEEDGVGNYYEIQVASWIDDMNGDGQPICRDCGPDDHPQPTDIPWIEEVPIGGEGVPQPADPSTQGDGLPMGLGAGGYGQRAIQSYPSPQYDQNVPVRYDANPGQVSAPVHGSGVVLPAEPLSGNQQPVRNSAQNIPLIQPLPPTQSQPVSWNPAGRPMSMGNQGPMGNGHPANGPSQHQMPRNSSYLPVGYNAPGNSSPSLTPSASDYGYPISMSTNRPMTWPTDLIQR